EAERHKIGLPADHDYGNLDGDPRGPWRDPGYKDARSGGESLAYPIRIPPYRWEVVGGHLPRGIWRLNGYTGVLWAGELLEEGTFRFVVRVTDSGGRSTEANCEICVAESDGSRGDESVWFLEAAPRESSSAPRVTNPKLPNGTVGFPYHSVL